LGSSLVSCIKEDEAMGATNGGSIPSGEIPAVDVPAPSGQIKNESTSLDDFKYKDPAEVDNSNLPITPVEEIHTTAQAPDVDITQYHLTIDGLVENPLALTYGEVLEYETVTEVVLLICQGVFVDNAEWTGVPVKTLLDVAKIKPEASTVTFRSIDGYNTVLPLDIALGEGVFLAHKVNGQILPDEHGYPLRLVVKGRYGWDWSKWVEEIDVW
jgi:sulfoxide reductase catalytic subunit YedY